MRYDISGCPFGIPCDEAHGSVNSLRVAMLWCLVAEVRTKQRRFFSRIADMVHKGLYALCQSRFEYCMNVVTGGCFMAGEFATVLAPHPLASFFSAQGNLMTMERKDMLPCDYVRLHFAPARQVQVAICLNEMCG